MSLAPKYTTVLRSGPVPLLVDLPSPQVRKAEPDFISNGLSGPVVHYPGDQFSSRRPCVVRFGSPPTKRENQPPSAATQAERRRSSVLFLHPSTFRRPLSLSPVKSSVGGSLPLPRDPEVPVRVHCCAVNVEWRNTERRTTEPSRSTPQQFTREFWMSYLLDQEASSSRKYRAMVRLRRCTRPAT